MKKCNCKKKKCKTQKEVAKNMCRLQETGFMNKDLKIFFYHIFKLQCYFNWIYLGLLTNNEAYSVQKCPRLIWLLSNNLIYTWRLNKAVVVLFYCFVSLNICDSRTCDRAWRRRGSEGALHEERVRYGRPGELCRRFWCKIEVKAVWTPPQPPLPCSGASHSCC